MSSGGRFDALDRVVEYLKRKEKTMGARESDPTHEDARRWNGPPIATLSSREPSTGRRASCSRRGSSPTCSSDGGRRIRSAVPVSCEIDVRVGGRYRFAFRREGAKADGVLRQYIEVTPNSRLVWTNEEGGDGAVTTVTFEEKGGKTLLVMHDLYPSKEALDGAFVGHGGRDGRDVRATGRASRHLERERRDEELQQISDSLDSDWLQWPRISKFS